MNQEQLKEIYLDQKRGFVKKDQLIERDIKLSKFINTSQKEKGEHSPLTRPPQADYTN